MSFLLRAGFIESSMRQKKKKEELSGWIFVSKSGFKKRHTLLCEVEEGGQWRSSGHARGGIAKFVEERVDEGGDGVNPDGGHILEELGEEVKGLRGRGLGLEDLGPWARFDLWEGELGVVRVHGLDLLAGWSSQDLNDFHKLIDGGLSREEGLTQHQLCHDTPRGPEV